MPAVIPEGKLPNCKCQKCGAEFYQPPSRIARGESKFCSKKCAGFNPEPNCTCKRCGWRFRMRPYNVAQGAGIYCSKECLIGTLDERFWEQVDKRGPDECWFWKGMPNHDGYGTMKYRGKTMYAARISYELANGPMPIGKEACHSCDDRYPVGDIAYRMCVNPAHIWAGTHRENIEDMHAKGRNRPMEGSPGSTNCMSKVDEATVLEIRALGASGTRGSELAAKYGLSRASVSMMLSRKTWAHI